MDFLHIAVLYMFLWVIGFSIYLTASFLPSFASHWLIKHLHQAFSEVLNLCIPDSLKSSCLQIYVQVFHSRNHIFQWLYLALVTASHYIVIVDAWPLLRHKDPQSDPSTWTFRLLVVNLILFAVCCYGNPGRITSKNVKKYCKAFCYDDVLYQRGRSCYTCGFVKPARSKHCAVTDECVMKFDHFCAWTNNSIGLLNHRYFILFLISICAMCYHGVAVATESLRHLTSVNQLWKVKYLDSRGQAQSMTFSVLTQTLFLKYPCLVFMAVALATLTVIMGAFTAYHLFLIATNQTTNERYKKHRLKNDKHSLLAPNIYNEGIAQNFLQAAFPYNIQHLPSNVKVVKKSNKTL